MIKRKIVSVKLTENKINNTEHFTEAVIIEDNAALQMAFQDALNMLKPGIKIKPFFTGEEALEYLEVRSAAAAPANKVILLDNELAGAMRGQELLEKLKHKIPANWVVLANSGNYDINQQMVASGAQATLDKQINNLFKWWQEP